MMNFGLGENDNRNMNNSMMNLFIAFLNMNNNMNGMNNMMGTGMGMNNNMNNMMGMGMGMNNNINNWNNMMNSINAINFVNFLNPFSMNNMSSFENPKIERKEGLDIKCDIDRLLFSNHELEHKNKDLQTIINYIPFTIIQDEPKK